jgi:hypothetical protein
MVGRLAERVEGIARVQNIIAEKFVPVTVKTIWCRT